MTDDEHLAAVLRRFLSDGIYRFYYIAPTNLTLDADVNISPEEYRALLRVTEGQVDGPALRRVDAEVYE